MLFLIHIAFNHKLHLLNFIAYVSFDWYSGDLSDLSNQTEQFASRLTNSKVASGALRGPSPDSVSSGSSYSSVVSNGSTQQTTDLNRGKFMGLEDSKKTANSQLNMADKHPGRLTLSYLGS